MGCFESGIHKKKEMERVQAMKKSLRQLARELGVSHSYLSQIKHGKRPASAKVVSKMVSKSKEPWLKDTKYFVPVREKCYNPTSKLAELCSGSTEDFGSFSPGSNPGSAAKSY